MCLLLLKGLFLLGLGLITYQDFKIREVSLVLFLGLAVLGGSMHYRVQYFDFFILNLIINCCSLVFLIGILFLYAKFAMNVKLKEAIGLGDLLFFMVLALSFPTFSFMFLLVLSFVFSLLLFLVLKPKLKNKTVPLAGLQALFLGLVISFNMIFNFVNLYAL